MRSLYKISLLAGFSFAATRDGKKTRSLKNKNDYIKFTATRKDVEFMDGPKEELFEDETPSRSSNDMRRQEQLEFSSFLAQNNKQYNSRDEYKKREKNWLKNQRRIEAMNRNSQSMATFGNNLTADLDEDEIRRMKGVDRSAFKDRKPVKLTYNDQ